jgi:hypothetical protein
MTLISFLHDQTGEKFLCLFKRIILEAEHLIEAFDELLGIFVVGCAEKRAEASDKADRIIAFVNKLTG